MPKPSPKVWIAVPIVAVVLIWAGWRVFTSPPVREPEGSDPRERFIETFGPKLQLDPRFKSIELAASDDGSVWIMGSLPDARTSQSLLDLVREARPDVAWTWQILTAESEGYTSESGEPIKLPEIGKRFEKQASPPPQQAP